MPSSQANQEQSDLRILAYKQWLRDPTTGELLKTLQSRRLKILQDMEEGNSDPAVTDIQLRLLIKESSVLRFLIDQINSGEFAVT